MADEGNGQPHLGRQFFEQRQDLRLRRDVEAGDDFVGKHEFRRQRQCAGDVDALALAAGQFMAVALAEILGQPDPPQRLGDAVTHIVAHAVLLQRRSDDGERWCGAD